MSNIIPTLVGQAKFAAAALDAQTPVALQSIVLGDGNGNVVVPLETQTALVNEVYSAAIQTVTVHPENANWVICTAVVPGADGPFTIREIGVKDAEGSLVAVGPMPVTEKRVSASGVDTTLELEILFVVAATANVTVSVSEGDYATQDYVAQAIPDFASAAETITGTLEDKKTHPAGVKAAIDAAIGGLPEDQVLGLATEVETIAGTNTTKATHAKGVKAAISAATVSVVAIDDDHDALKNQEIWCDTSDQAITVRLSETPADGDTISVIRQGDNDVTIDRNTNKIGNVADDLLLDVDNRGVRLVFDTHNWKFSTIIVGNS